MINLMERIMAFGKLKLLTLGLIVAVAAALIAWPTGQQPVQKEQVAGHPPAAALKVDNSTNGQLQAGGVNLQPSGLSGSAASPDPAGQSSVQSSGNTNPSPPPTSTSNPTTYPPCYYCQPGAGHMCPLRPAVYPCQCGGDRYD